MGLRSMPRVTSSPRIADQSQLTYSPRFTTPLRASPVVATAVTVAQSYDDDVHIMANLLVRFSPRATKTSGSPCAVCATKSACRCDAPLRPPNNGGGECRSSGNTTNY